MIELKKIGFGILISLASASSFAECYAASSSSKDMEFRYCKVSQSGFQTVIDWTNTIIGSQEGGFGVESPGYERSKNISYSYTGTFKLSGSGIQVFPPDGIGAGKKTKRVEWTRTTGRVKCGQRARWELRANMDKITYRIEGRIKGKGNWLKFGQRTFEKFKNGQVGLRVIDKVTNVEC